MAIGNIREIWRYPVKSMSGEKLDSCAVGVRGLLGDRGWALRDEIDGEIRGAKQWPMLMQCTARYREEPTGETIPHVDITLPNGSHLGSDDPKANARLSELIGRPVSLWPLQPPTNKAHYKRAQAGSFIMSRMSRSHIFRPFLQSFISITHLDAPLRDMFSREPDEPLPDLSVFPSELFEFTSPPGTYFDAYPIHMLTTASLTAMSRVNPGAIWDTRRFRPNFLIGTHDSDVGLVEASWSRRTLHLGELSLRCEIPTVRCGMTTHAQAELPKDSTILRSIVRDAGQNLGFYASVTSGGWVRVGDVVESH